MELRQYTTEEIAAIHTLFIKTFTDSEGTEEGAIVGDLARELMETTDAKDLYVFVALEGGAIIGSIIFSRLTFESGESAFILSPVAVHTAHQGKGIGQKLINFGLEMLKADGVELVFTYGDIMFYSKVGFRQIKESLIKSPLKLSYPDGWLAQSLEGEEIAPIAEKPTCVAALNKPEVW